jgi:hypothetical protein
MAIALEHPLRDCLPGPFFLMAIPAQRTHVLQRLLQLI